MVIDDLSAPALVLNLRAAAGSDLEQVLAFYRKQAQPAFLTYRQLQGGANFEPSDPATRIIFICENPSLVSAAARELGPRCRPLDPHERTARVRRSFAFYRGKPVQSCVCHADFDWAGLRIVDQLAREYAAIPWRMQVEDYRDAGGNGDPHASVVCQ